ncbi:hypothetical protein KR038_011752 [Drosophila bunnanda]|nr:hypothetical protein KR038_011752 [Drosophila bunnanda]
MPPSNRLRVKEPPLQEPVNGIVQPPVWPSPNSMCRRTSVLESLKTVLTAIWQEHWAFIFRQPVDAKQFGMIHYHEVIKRPMDLGTIKKRLNNNYYRNGDQAIQDFKLIYANCFRFYKKGTIAHKAGTNLKTYFHHLLSTIDLSNEVRLPLKRKWEDAFL